MKFYIIEDNEVIFETYCGHCEIVSKARFAEIVRAMYKHRHQNVPKFEEVMVYHSRSTR